MGLERRTKIALQAPKPLSRSRGNKGVAVKHYYFALMMVLCCCCPVVVVIVIE